LEVWNLSPKERFHSPPPRLPDKSKFELLFRKIEKYQKNLEKALEKRTKVCYTKIE